MRGRTAGGIFPRRRHSRRPIRMQHIPRGILHSINYHSSSVQSSPSFLLASYAALRVCGTSVHARLHRGQHMFWPGYRYCLSLIPMQASYPLSRPVLFRPSRASAGFLNLEVQGQRDPPKRLLHPSETRNRKPKAHGESMLVRTRLLTTKIPYFGYVL